MSSKVPPPPIRAPMNDLNGNLSPVWADWFKQIFQRIGGSIALTNDEIETDITVLNSLATDKLVGRDAAGTGAASAIGVTGGIEFDGSSNIRTTALTGDVTKTAGGTTTTISDGVVSFAKMLSTDWTNNTAASGGTKLPNGIVLRWGVTASMATGTTSSTSFSSAFPTACRQVIASPQGNSASATTATGHWGTGNYSTTSFDMYNRTSITLTFNYLAVGY